MKVILGADPDQERERICVWHPDAYQTVFPLLLETTDGHLFRLTNPISSIKPEHELVYLSEVFNPKSPKRAIDHIVDELGDRFDQEVKAQLLALLESFQRHIHTQASHLASQAMKITELELKLKASGTS
jgi:hypothetical protein